MTSRRILLIILSLISLHFFVSNVFAQKPDDTIVLDGRPFLIEEPKNLNLLILTPHKFRAQADTLAMWKNKLGFQVDIVETDNIKGYTKLKEVSEQYIDSGTNFILILGNSKDVPSYRETGFIGDDFQITDDVLYTDFYYGCIGKTLTPHMQTVVPVGRIAGDMIYNISYVINKIIRYESSPSDDNAYYSHALNIAFFQDDNNDGIEDRGFTFTSEKIAEGLNEQNIAVTKHYSTNSKSATLKQFSSKYADGSIVSTQLNNTIKRVSLSPQPIIDRINNGCCIVLYKGHGYKLGLGEPEFDYLDLNQLHNGENLPLFVIPSCSTINLAPNNTISFGTTIQNYFNNYPYTNDGCIAYIGASNVVHSGFSDAFAFGIYGAIWNNRNFRPYTNYNSSGKNTESFHTSRSAIRLGTIMNYGRYLMCEYHQNSGRALELKYNIAAFQLLGDPSMVFHSKKPTEFSRPSITIERDNGSIIFKISGGEDIDRITVFSDSINDFDTRQSNNVQFTFSDTNCITKNFGVCITGKNKIPYIEYVEIPKATTFIQNETISGSKHIENNFIKIGSNVNTNAAAGDVKISNANIDIICESIDIFPDTEIDENTTINVEFPE